ncbi:MAG: hypothetical protein AB1894_26710 [Chloroflexota bacterium]
MKTQTHPTPTKTWSPQKASSPAAASYTAEQVYGDLAEALSTTKAAQAPGAAPLSAEDFETASLWFYA